MECRRVLDDKTSDDLLKKIDSMKWSEIVEGLSTQAVDDNTVVVWYKKLGNEWEL